MTVFWENPAAPDPATHAFVMGVGHYPHKSELNIASAADSAKWMVDWLIRNADNLVPPLGSIEVLISDPPDDENRYSWSQTVQPEPTTHANIVKAGERWVGRFGPGTSNTAFFYACGHGVSLSSEPVVVTEELDQSSNQPWTYVHVSSLARSLRQNENVEAAFLFIDACSERVASLELLPAEHRKPAIFYPATAWEVKDRNNTGVLCAAPGGELAFEAPLPRDPAHPERNGVQIGCFTQTLVRALDGWSIREWNGKWAVSWPGLQSDLKQLMRYSYPLLSKNAFEPTPLYGFNEERVLVLPPNPRIPVVVRTRPETEFDRFFLCINEEEPAPREPKVSGDRVAKCWRLALTPGRRGVFAVIFDEGRQFHVEIFPYKPYFDIPVRIELTERHQ